MTFLLGVVIGSVLGLTGAGGSVFAVPLLILALKLPIVDAIGVAMGAVAVSALYGSIRNFRGKSILWVQATLLGVSGVICAPLGRWLGAQTDESVLLIGFSVLAFIIALRMFWQTKVSPEASAITRSSNLRQQNQSAPICRMSPTGQFQWGLRCVGGLLVSGSLVGLLTGLFGVGGGFLIVPLLIYLNQVSFQQAIATSLVIIAAVSSSGFASYLFSAAKLDYSLLSIIAAGGVFGMLLGQMIAQKISGPKLQQMFAICLASIAGLMIFMA